MSLEATFLAPMREFVQRELREVKELKENVHKAHEEYLAALQRSGPGSWCWCPCLSL